jgi:dynein heavy chain 2, cytosolic
MLLHAQKRLKTCTMWTSPLPQLRPALEGASQLLQHWQGEVQALTRYWSLGVETGGHQWVGDPLADPYVASLQSRIEEVGAWLR